ncbi:RHS repeat-associated core domain-containing protein [Motiliproteus sp. MSK22-1]|uniref:RHS repeat-associated core domain-containing protein n=1 Tax=Motiliproteus sp. MSK22-1 TaxID=1897630 RepID=UPI000975E973|nr:RHS repeat-associated core domain-containing protein [Motiliproteus sp. MSK22-1]OMH31652.1 hypothetical protein BGP75_16100 [Motiliproteus sp. MSK22-1]
MIKQTLIRIATVIITGLLSLEALAVGGITSDNAPPNFATGKINETFTDLTVKVLGGTVRTTRYWEDGKWIWNRRWADLEPAWINVEDQHPSSFRRIDSYYPRIVGESTATYENQLIYTITYREEQDEYRWADRKGNVIDYAVERDDNGKITRIPMVRYSDRNGVTVSVDRNEQGEISAVRDYHGNVVVNFDWEPGSKPGEYQIAKVSDYSGRNVLYHYDGEDKLIGIDDPRGKRYSFTYDSNGQLSSFSDAKGQATTYNMSPSIAAADAVSISAGGQTCTFSRDQGGELKGMTNADGAGSTYETSFNEDKRVFIHRETDATGVVKEKEYDEHGTLVSFGLGNDARTTRDVILSDGSIGVANLVDNYSYSYGITVVTTLSGGLVSKNCYATESGGVQSQVGSGALTYVAQTVDTDPRGGKTVTEYDQFKNVLRKTYPDGSSESTTYDVRFSLPLTETDARGVVTEYQYDDSGNLLALIEAKGLPEQRTTRYEYDGYGQLIKMITGESVAGGTELAVTRWKYDDRGNMVEETDPLDNVTSYSEFDALGNSFRITDAETNYWLRSFDAVGNRLSDVNPLSQGQHYRYDKAGNLEQLTKANGSTSSFTTNAAGFPLMITNMAGKRTILEYDSSNRLTAFIDANSNSSLIGYNDQGSLASHTDGMGNQFKYSYQNERLSAIHTPSYDEFFTYDSRNRIINRTIRAEEIDVTNNFSYDVNNNLIGSSGEKENSDSRQYDIFNRLIRFTDVSGGITSYKYDSRDNIIRVIDPEEGRTDYSYTLNNQIAEEIRNGDSGNTVSRTYQYSKLGSLIAEINPSDEKISYNYDNANRLVGSKLYAHKDNSSPIKVVEYSYNESGQYTGYSQRVGSASSGLTSDISAHSEIYKYNDIDQLINVVVDYGSFQKNYSYSYYPNGLKKSYTNPEGITYSYHYNKNNQLEAVVIPGIGSVAYSDFDWILPQTLTLPGGTVVRYQYDDLQRQKQQNIFDAASNGLGKSLYGYDTQGNVISIETEHGDYSFSYDKQRRITTSSYPEGVGLNSTSELFAYDGVGNRVSHETIAVGSEISKTVTGTYNARNQLIEKGGEWRWSYNDNGHVIKKEYIGADTENNTPIVTNYTYNREERLIEVHQDGITVAQYAYDSYGRRIRKNSMNTTVFYLYTEQGLAAEYDADGSLIKEYQYGPYGKQGSAPLFQRTVEGKYYYYQNDQIGTPVRLLAANGSVVWEARYEVFGQAHVLTNQVINNLRFPGQYYDQETKLHQNYFRDYDPSLGRYLQSDPIGLKGGLNTYAYAFANPLTLTDRLGLYCEEIGGITIPDLFSQKVSREKINEEWNIRVELILQSAAKPWSIPLMIYTPAKANCYFHKTITELVKYELHGKEVSWGYCVDCGVVDFYGKEEDVILERWEKEHKTTSFEGSMSRGLRAYNELLAELACRDAFEWWSNR